jgi:hypothetical protein
MEQAKAALRSNQVMDKNTGRVDLRYNPLSVDEDYFLPVRGDSSGTKIDTLAGGTNVTAIEDVEYIQKKLFAALKIPRAYLGYDEMLSSKATLAQEDIRFSRTINSIQRIMISELNKLAIIHLFSHGYDGEDLLNFEIQLSNPSTIAQQQKLELYRTRFEISGQAPEGMLSRDYIRRNILGLTKKDILLIEKEKFFDKERDLEIESVTLPGEGGAAVGMAAPAEMPMGGEEMGGGEAEAEAAPGEGEATAGLFAGQERDLLGLLNIQEDDEPDDDDPEDESPINLTNRVKRNSKKRRGRHKRAASHMPDFKLRGSAFSESSTAGDVLDSFYGDKMREHAKMTQELQSTLKTLEKSIDIKRNRHGVLLESDEGADDEDEQ